MDNDYEIEDYSNSDDEDEYEDEDNDDDADDSKQEMNKEIDFTDIKSRLQGMRFDAKKDFPVLVVI